MGMTRKALARWQPKVWSDAMNNGWPEASPTSSKGARSAGWLVSIVLVLLVLPLLTVPSAFAQTPDASPGTAIPGDGTPAAAPPADATPVGAASTASSPEQQLIEKYAPIMALKDQTSVCDTDGEPYFPVAVEAVLGDPTVALKRATGSSSESDQVVKTAPTAQDLFAKGDGYYLDLPGNPRKPGCDYATWFAERKDHLTPTTYAHIVSDGSGRLALQYWFYYVFNDFNNKHESDWEMIQILFPVGTVEEALTTDPVQVAFAQHGGGETAAWTSSKLQRQDTHPIVYAAAGSHASQYGNATWLGWGENGTGFGCDITTAPSHLVPLTPVLLPNKVTDPASPFAWLTYTGRWGERKSGEYNGPTGPNTKKQWTSPFLWQAGLRDSSIEVPGAKTFGPAPTGVFCTLSGEGSAIFTRIGENPMLLVATAVGILAVITVLLRYSWGLVRLAMRVYRLRWRTFAVIGLLLIPIGILFNGFQYLLGHYPPGSVIISVMDKSPGSYFAVALLVGILQHLVGLVVVGPAVIETYDEMERNEQLSAIDAYQRVIRQFRQLVGPVLKSSVIVVILSLTVIGIPVALWLLVRWYFIPQAVMLDDQQGGAARATSAKAVDGHWLSSALKLILLAIIGAAPGAFVGLILLIFGSASVQTTNVVSSLIYAVALPFSILGTTILYRQHQGRPITPLRQQGTSTDVRNAAGDGDIAPRPIG
ncbi:MAG: hypothetical protein QM753_09355 [Thermomicrobiales bacterium]